MFTRRAFLSLIAGTGTGILFTPTIWKTIDDASIWTQNWPWIPSLHPGKNVYTHNVISGLCPSKVAIKLRKIEERPVRTLPANDHPLGGGLTSLAAAEVQMLQSPSRVKSPLKKVADGSQPNTIKIGSNYYVPISWSEAGKLFAEKVLEAKDSIGGITGEFNTIGQDILSAFINQCGSDKTYLMPCSDVTNQRAAMLVAKSSGGAYDDNVMLSCKIQDDNDFILSINANFMESYGPVAATRKVLTKSSPKIYYAGHLNNQTALTANTWLKIKPGTEMMFIAGLLQKMAAAGSSGNYSEQIAVIANLFKIKEIVEHTGVSEKEFEELAIAIRDSKNPAIVIDIAPGKDPNVVAAGYLLNYAATKLYFSKPAASSATLTKLLPAAIDKAEDTKVLCSKDTLAWINSSPNVKVLIFHEANPVYELPGNDIKDKLEKVPFKVAFCSLKNETAAICDLILPTPMGLEKLRETVLPFGNAEYYISAPLVSSEFDVRPFEDFLIFISNQIAKEPNIKAAFVSEGTSYLNLLKKRTLSIGLSYDDLLKGNGSYLKYSFFKPEEIALINGLSINSSSYIPKESKLTLITYEKLSMGTSLTGIPPFNTKVIKEKELQNNTVGAFLNSNTAKSFNLNDGELISLKSEASEISAYVRISEAITPNCVAICQGFGHTAFDEFSQNKGANVIKMMVPTKNDSVEFYTWGYPAVTVKKV